MARLKNRNWNLSCSEDDRTFSIEHIKIALLMDIRDELQQLNRVLACPNFQTIPGVLRRISVNTTKPKRRQRAA